MKDEEKYKIEFGIRFTELLRVLNISGYQLAKEFGVTEATISNIKQGKTLPNANFLNLLLNKIKVLNLSWLITGIGNKFMGNTSAEPITHTSGEDIPYKQLVKEVFDIKKQLDNLKNK